MEGPSTSGVDRKMEREKNYQQVENSPQESPTTTPQNRCTEMLVNVALLSNGLNIGLNVGLLGPSLPDLALQTGSTIVDMNVVFVFSSIAYMLGSLLCGLMLGRIEGYLVISVTLILQALCVAASPWCTNLVLLTTFFSLAYFFSTVIIAGTAFLCFRLERTRARVMTQSVFLLFNLGKAVVPFVLAPFLSQETVVEEPISSITRPRPSPRRPNSWLDLFLNLESSLNATMLSGFGDHDDNASRKPDKFKTSIGYGYFIIACFSLLMSLLYMLVAFKHGCHLWAAPDERVADNKSEVSTNVSSSTSKVRKATVLFAFFIMIFLQCGMESVDAGLLMSFLTEYLHRSKDMGVVANAVYQGVKVIACIVVVLTVKYIHPSSLLLIDFLFMVVSTSLMAVSIYFRVGDGLLWTTFVLLALGMSNSYATLASWLETRYRITGMVTSILTISFGLGSMILPSLTTTLLDQIGPIMFPLILLACSILCFITYFINKLLMQEACCPKTDIKDAPTRETVLTSSERQGLLEGATEVTDGGAISQNGPIRERRSPRILKRQSLSDLAPDQCFHAYHSRFMNEPSAPSEYTILYKSDDK